jgi:nitrite reductase (NADH) large subunit
VDPFLRSSDPDIFVAGDLVEFEGVVWGIIPAALDHAPIVANNVLGRPLVAYRQTIPQNTLKVTGIHLTSIGKVNPEGAEGEDLDIVSRLDEKNERYEKYVLEDGKLAGSILFGSRKNLPFVLSKIGKETAEKEIRARLW